MRPTEQPVMHDNICWLEICVATACGCAGAKWNGRRALRETAPPVGFCIISCRETQIFEFDYKLFLLARLLIECAPARWTWMMKFWVNNCYSIFSFGWMCCVRKCISTRESKLRQRWRKINTSVGHPPNLNNKRPSSKTKKEQGWGGGEQDGFCLLIECLTSL